MMSFGFSISMLWLNGKSRLICNCYYRHKADRAALWLSCDVCFEALARVFACAGASFEKPDDTLTKNRAIRY